MKMYVLYVNITQHYVLRMVNERFNLKKISDSKKE